jgi:hypothetical protein
MNRIDWYVEGIEFGSCNCIYACPCQFEGLPTHGNCCGFEVLRIPPASASRASPERFLPPAAWDYWRWMVSDLNP